jgi:hypothetical protein
MNKIVVTTFKKVTSAAAALTLLMAAGGAARTPATALPRTPVNTATILPNTPANAALQEITQTKFYCNIKALNPEERANQRKLTEKLIGVRTAIVEIDRGYEFQFTPATVSLAELAEWSVAEAKCCPFFDFHLDLEREGKLLCLRLTGQEGIKPFIRTEFQVPAK